MNNRIFALFFLGILLVFAGAGSYLVTIDRDYHYYTMGQEDHAKSGSYLYETLPPEQQKNVDRALYGDSDYVFIEKRKNVPPQFVKKDGEYYGFRSYSVRDTSDGGSPYALGAIVLGLALFAESFRQNYFTNYLSMPWDGVTEQLR